MVQRKLNAHSLGKALGIYPYALRNYLKKKRPSVTDDDIVRICEYLKIKLELKIEVDA
jgi:predicted transcriptional regulator